MELTYTSEMPSAQIFTVDAFTQKPFQGNPAAVCVLDRELSTDRMQAIAAEMNLSETAFVETQGVNKFQAHSRKFKLRWLTPKCEVDLCGHATLATAAVIFYELGNPNDIITFSTRSGELLAKREGTKICMDLPLNPPVAQEQAEVEDIIKLCTADLLLADIQYSASTKKLLLCLADSCSRGDLEALRPDTQALVRSHDGSKVRGVIVTVKASEDGYDFFSRYFAPWVAIPEDPVCGAAHTVLAPYWAERLGVHRPLNARQCSQRGGDLQLRICDDNRLEVLGEACVVLRGRIYPFADNQKC